MYKRDMNKCKNNLNFLENRRGQKGIVSIIEILAIMNVNKCIDMLKFSFLVRTIMFVKSYVTC